MHYMKETVNVFFLVFKRILFYKICTHTFSQFSKEVSIDKYTLRNDRIIYINFLSFSTIVQTTLWSNMTKVCQSY